MPHRSHPAKVSLVTTEVIRPEDLARVRALCDSGAARAVRLGKRLSLREMADGVGDGVSPSTILRWESRERTPRGSAAIAYLALLDRLMGAR